MPLFPGTLRRGLSVGGCIGTGTGLTDSREWGVRVGGCIGTGTGLTDSREWGVRVDTGWLVKLCALWVYIRIDEIMLQPDCIALHVQTDLDHYSRMKQGLGDTTLASSRPVY